MAYFSKFDSTVYMEQLICEARFLWVLVWSSSNDPFVCTATYFNFPFSNCLQSFLCTFFFLLISAMRRDVVVEVSSRGMIKTGLKSDICQVRLAVYSQE